MYGKLEDSKAVNTSGVGIGLAVSDSLARSLNNRKNLETSIQVESKLGEGTTFRFNISTDIEAGLKLVQESPNFRASMLAEIPEAHKRPLNLLAKHQLYEYIKPSWHKPTSLNQIILHEDSSSPLKEPNSSRSHRDSQSGITPGTKPMKCSTTVAEKEVWVLAVDDNPFNLLIIKQILEERKFKFITACNGQEGVNAFKEHIQAGGVWSFVLMDCQMPVMDGFEAAKTIRQYIIDNKLKNIPIFALTANNAEEDVKRSYDSGMNEHILKPLTISKLDSVVWKYHIA
jgi:FOG: CheY-like receiver